MFMSWLKLQRGLHYVYVMVKAVEGAYMFMSWLKLKWGGAYIIFMSWLKL